MKCVLDLEWQQSAVQLLEDGSPPIMGASHLMTVPFLEFASHKIYFFHDNFFPETFIATCLLRLSVLGEVCQTYVMEKVGGWSLMTRTGRWRLLTRLAQSGSEPVGQAPGLYLTL